MFEGGTAVEPETGDAGNREFDRQHIALLAGRVVTGCAVDGTHRAVGKGLGVETCSRLGVLIVPEANCVLCHYESYRLSTRPSRRPATRGSAGPGPPPRMSPRRRRPP